MYVCMYVCMYVLHIYIIICVRRETWKDLFLRVGGGGIPKKSTGFPSHSLSREPPKVAIVSKATVEGGNPVTPASGSLSFGNP